jgi:hypothetical protein
MHVCFGNLEIAALVNELGAPLRDSRLLLGLKFVIYA